MTFAPETLIDARSYLKGQDPDLDNTEVGIVGGPSHIRQGTSYHLGADQLIMSKNPYSARTSRDRAGLSNAASALDIDDDLDELRALSLWMVQQCQAGAPDTLDIREIIFSPDGVNVFRWDRERGQTSAPVPDGDLSHRTHTHVSYYRDSEFRDKTGLYRRFFEGGAVAITQSDINAIWHLFEAQNERDMAQNLGESWKFSLASKENSEKALTVMDEMLAKLDQILNRPAVPVDEDLIRRIVREEIDNTKLGEL